MSRFEVIKDTREKSGHGWWFDEDEYCVGTTKSTVKIGDYTLKGLEKLLVIERKESVSEFAGNCSESRFWREIESMAKYKYKFLVLEFSIFDIERYPEGSSVPRAKWSSIKIRANYMLSLLSTIMADKDIHVIFAGNAVNAQRIIYRIMRKIWDLEKHNIETEEDTDD